MFVQRPFANRYMPSFATHSTGEMVEQTCRRIIAPSDRHIDGADARDYGRDHLSAPTGLPFGRKSHADAGGNVRAGFDRLISAACSGVVAALLALVTLGVGVADAQNYPSRPIRLIVPFAPGGLVDVTARLLQPHLEKSLGQSIIIENRPAASGIVGTDTVAKAAPDGYSLLLVASSHTVIPATTAKLPYDAERDLAPIGIIGKNPLLFVVGANLPARTLGEFVALAKGSPAKLNYATPGAATQAMLVTELFSQRAGITMQHIPYRGSAPAVMATVAGETQFTVVSPVTSLPQIQAGKLRAIAAGTLVRDEQFPNLPTVAEQGFANFEAIQWEGLLTTAGTPPAIIERLNAELNRALRSPDLVARLAELGVSPAGGTTEEFRELIGREIRNWTEVARAANIKAEP
jgi:tripartite-type tricarboxylate transporter receptor subunit TctC